MAFKLAYLENEDLMDKTIFEGPHRVDQSGTMTLSYIPIQKLLIEDLTNKEETSISSDIYLEPQDEGGFVAFSRECPGAVGQGETEEEALKDLEEAIQLLKEVLEENKALKK